MVLGTNWNSHQANVSPDANLPSIPSNQRAGLLIGSAFKRSLTLAAVNRPGRSLPRLKLGFVNVPLPHPEPSSYPVHAAKNTLANPNCVRELQQQRTSLGFGLISN